jgi:hypothetical protein
MNASVMSDDNGGGKMPAAATSEENRSYRKATRVSLSVQAQADIADVVSRNGVHLDEECAKAREKKSQSSSMVSREGSSSELVPI